MPPPSFQKWKGSRLESRNESKAVSRQQTARCVGWERMAEVGDDLRSMTIRELNELLQSHGVNASGATDKAALVEFATAILQCETPRSAPNPASTSAPNEVISLLSSDEEAEETLRPAGAKGKKGKRIKKPTKPKRVDRFGKAVRTVTFESKQLYDRLARVRSHRLFVIDTAVVRAEDDTHVDFTMVSKRSETATVTGFELTNALSQVGSNRERLHDNYRSMAYLRVSRFWQGYGALQAHPVRAFQGASRSRPPHLASSSLPPR